jgi:hypothetical protein
MPAPHEVVATPLTIYLAAIGSTFPDIDADPTAPWDLLGTEGDRNYNDAGVTVSHAETVADFTPAGSTMPSKRFRTGEDFLISLNLVDLGPTAYAKVMNDAEVTNVPAGIGNPGEDYFSLYRGDQVNAFAVLAKGMSTVDNDLALQYQFSKAFVSVDGDVVWNKGTPAMLPVKIQAIRHSDSDLIEVHIQTAAAS